MTIRDQRLAGFGGDYERILSLLIVEDNPGDAALMNDLLTQHIKGETAIHHCSTLARAREILRREAVDAVILDLGLPDSRGIDTVKGVVEVPGDKMIIVVAGAIDHATAEQFRDAGATDVFGKDEFDSRLFPRVLTELILRRRSQDRTEQLEMLVEAMPDAVIIVDTDGLVRCVNQAALSLFGVESQDFIGELLGFSVLEGLTSEITVPRASGSRICEMRIASVIWDGQHAYLAAIRDVTERRLAEQALRQSETHFAAAQRIAEIGSFVVEPGGARTGTEQYYRIYGFDPEGDMAWDDFMESAVSQADRQRLTAHDQAAWLGRNPSPLEYEVCRASDGLHRNILRDVELVRDADGEPAALIGVIRDVTDLRIAEARSRKLNFELEQRVEARTADLVAANKELEAFSYSVSHDLRTPLRAIDWLAHSALAEAGEVLPPEARSKITAIGASVEQMSRLIEDLLAFSRIGRQRLRRIDIDTNALLSQVVDDLHNAYPDAGIQVEVEPLPMVRGDPTLIRLVFQNLLDNAIKFSRSMKSPFIRVGCHDIDPTSTAPRIFYVQDNGIGFDMRFADKLFGVFQQLHARQIYHGTGIGLAIVQRIVHRHGGHVWADSRVGEGAIFSFTLEPEREAVTAPTGEASEHAS